MAFRYIEFRTDKRIPKVLYIQFESERTGQKARNMQAQTLNKNIDKKWVPVKEISREIQMNKSAAYQTYRKQFPVSPAEALTVHKAQGSTCESVCVNVKKSLNRDLLYVALSRVTTLRNLYIVGEFRPTKPPNADNETKLEINRLKTEMRMNFCYNTFHQKLGTIIAYHNVASFNKYKIHISNDGWYNKCDILILAETQTAPDYQPELFDFKIVHRSNVQRTIGTRGILIFVKPNIAFNLLDYQIRHSHNQTKKYHIEVFIFETTDLIIVTGYKSPSTPMKDLEELISNALTTASSKNCKRHVLIGDFNVDLSQKGNRFKEFLSNFSMESKLAESESTTNHNTQIDVIFANYQNIVAGTYESYFSDHKPIYCMNHDGKLPPEFHQYLQTSVPIKVQQPPPTILLPTQHQSLPSSPISIMSGSALGSPIVISDSEPILIPDTGAFATELLRIAALTMEQMTTEIGTAFEWLTNFTVDHFLEEIVKRYFPQYEVQPTVFSQAPHRFKEAPIDRDDVQIILADRHYIVSHFTVADDVVNLYDSLYTNIQPGHMEILRRIYPGRRCRVVKLATAQPDLAACGVFAIANVTSIVLGENPAEYSLRIEHTLLHPDATYLLRNHLILIFEKNTLTLFPSSQNRL